MDLMRPVAMTREYLLEVGRIIELIDKLNRKSDNYRESWNSGSSKFELLKENGGRTGRRPSLKKRVR